MGLDEARAIIFVASFAISFQAPASISAKHVLIVCSDSCSPPKNVNCGDNVRAWAHCVSAKQTQR